MSQVAFIAPVEYISGKLSKQHKVAFAHRTKINGQGFKKNYTSWREPVLNPVFTDEQKAAQARFKAVAQAVRTRKSDPSTAATDKAAFKAQSTYKTLQAYLWAVCAAEYDNQHNG